MHGTGSARAAAADPKAEGACEHTRDLPSTSPQHSGQDWVGLGTGALLLTAGGGDGNPTRAAKQDDKD